jgi:predicted NACHT family NTPase
VSQITEFLASNDNTSKNLEAEAVLDAIVIQQGILVERARDVYSFSHLTLRNI